MRSNAARTMLEAHINAERNRNLDKVMATLSDNPRYLIPNFRLEGRQALRAMYDRVLQLLPAENSEEYLQALDDPRVSRWGGNHLVLEYTDDYPLHRGMVVVVHFDGNRVKSENTYYTAASRFSSMINDVEFLMIPGVTTLTSAGDDECGP